MMIQSFLSGPLSVNCYVAYDETTKKGFIVDPGGKNEQLSAFCKQEGLTIEYIILTHGHGDHIGGVEAYLNEFAGSKLVASINERGMLENSGLNMSSMTQGYAISLHADQYVEDGDTLSVGNLLLRFIHTPGHTPGGMCIYVDNVVFTGDTLFQQSIGRTDFPGSSFAEIQSSIRKKLFLLPDETTVLPGHMGATTIGFEKENNPFV